MTAGGLVVIFHQKLADNLGGGVSSYERFKFWGLITCGVGFAIMLSLHTIPLNWLLNSLFVTPCPSCAETAPDARKNADARKKFFNNIIMIVVRVFSFSRKVSKRKQK